MFERSLGPDGIRRSARQMFKAKRLRDDRDKIKRNLADKAADPQASRLISPIITLVVGRERRVFAAHEDILCLSPFFAAALRGQFREADARQVEMPDEDPQIFSAVLEYLYKGDYYPRLRHNKRSSHWELENQSSKEYVSESLIHSPVYGGDILRDTVIYCVADKYGLDDLKRLALRKQGLVSGIEVPVLLRSARFAYDNTPDSDSKLRAHYLALIIRSRRHFKRSGTMQAEMELGGKLFFDLFVAMCNHMDDIVDATRPPA